MIQAGIQKAGKVFAEIVGACFETHESAWFKEYLIDEGFELITEIEAPCSRKEYDDFVVRNISPISCRAINIFCFQARILRLIFESPRIAERIQVEYMLSENN